MQKPNHMRHGNIFQNLQRCDCMKKSMIFFFSILFPLKKSKIMRSEKVKFQIHKH